MKELGFNAVSVAVPWILHELEKGNSDFETENKNLDRFLSLCDKYGFYVILKPGPIVDADLLNGGLPIWLIEDHPKIRAMNHLYEYTEWNDKKSPAICYAMPTYLRFIENYIRNLAPIIRKHLYPEGGIILIQADSPPYFGGHTDLYSVDYNIVSIHNYRFFLKGKYGDIARINGLYDTGFYTFDNVIPPTLSSFEDAVVSLRESRRKGEFLRILEWMEFKEKLIEDYIAHLCFLFKKNGILIPYCASVIEPVSPVNIGRIASAYKTGVMVRIKYIYPYYNYWINGDLPIELKGEILESESPYGKILPDLYTGWPTDRITPDRVHILGRLIIGHGFKGLNLYMAVGGLTPHISYKGRSVQLTPFGETIGYHPEKGYYSDGSGDSYDFGAPIGQMGQHGPIYGVVRLLNMYLSANSDLITRTRKVYDNIAFVYYHPYTRIKFNTGKLGCVIDYRRYNGVYRPSESEILLRTLNMLGIRPKIVNIEGISAEELERFGLIILPMFNFMSVDVMKKIVNYVRNGGTLISFGDIPVYNDKMEEEPMLAEIFGVEVRGEDNEEEIEFMGEKFDAFETLLLLHVIHDDDAEIIAWKDDEQGRKIYGIKRKFGAGYIYHLGFVFSPISTGREVLRKFLKTAGYIGNKTTCSSHAYIVRQRDPETGEEAVTVANLGNEPINNMTVIFGGFGKNGDGKLTLTSLDIPPISAIQWTLEKNIGIYSKIAVCTSEIIAYHRSENGIYPRIKIEGYHFPGSRNLIRLVMKAYPSSAELNGINLNEYFNKIEPVDIGNISGLIFGDCGGTGNEKMYNLMFYYGEDVHLKLTLEKEGNIVESLEIILEKKAPY